MNIAKTVDLKKLYIFTVPLLVLGVLGNVIAWLTLGILPDEAYYWVWSQRLELSYYDHPPFVAWFIWPFVELFGHSVVSVRLPTVLAWLLTSYLAFDFARRVYGNIHVGYLAVLIWTSMPIVMSGFHIVTPDSPFILFTWLVFYLVWRTVAEERYTWWLVVGTIAGLSMLSKYPAVLTYAAIFLALLFTSQGRQHLATIWPWLGVLLGLLLFMPVVVWNWQNEWISFAFQFQHGVQETISPEPLNMFLLFLGGQLGVVMPWTWLGMVWASISSKGQELLQPFTRHLLRFGFWLPLIVFGAAGLTAKSGPNWPAAAYVTGTILFSGLLYRILFNGTRFRTWFGVTILFLGLVTIVLINALRFPAWMQTMGLDSLTTQRTQLSQAYDWPVVHRKLDELLPMLEKSHPMGESCLILADNHARSAMLAWLLRAPERVGLLSTGRMSQYQIWDRDVEVSPNIHCLYVHRYGWGRKPSDINEEIQTDGITWVSIDSLEVVNPDLSRRLYVFYVPK